MDVDEVPPALQQGTPADQGEVSKSKGKAKDVGEKKRFEVKKVQHNAISWSTAYNEPINDLWFVVERSGSLGLGLAIAKHLKLCRWLTMGSIRYCCR